MNIREEGFFCATPDGTIATDRPSVHDWEKFKLVDLATVALAPRSTSFVSLVRQTEGIPRSIHQTFPGSGVHQDSQAAGLIYNNTGRRGTFLKKHYSDLTEDIVL